MHDEFVKRRQWLTAREFLDLLGATHFIPGPNSTEMAIHIGCARAGLAGLIVAGACFITPSALLVGAIAAVYVRFGTLPQFEWMLYAIKPVVIVIILLAILDLGISALKTRFLVALGIGAIAASVFGIGELFVLFGSALLSLAWHRSSALRGSLAMLPPDVFLYFLKVGSVLFGSGYVLVAFLRADLVEQFRIITEKQLMDAIAVGQITPGPLFTTATFVGYLVAGSTGAIVATIGIFLPGFIFVGLTHRFVRRLRENRIAQPALDGINVAAVALMVIVTWQLAQSAFVDLFSWVIAVAAAVILWRYRRSAPWLVLGAAGTGLIAQAIVR